MSYTPPPPPMSEDTVGSAQPQTSTMSLVSLIAGIISVPAFGCLIFSVAAIIFGVLGKKEVAASGGRLKGGGMAKAGLILGIVSLTLAVIINVLVFTGVFPYDFDFNTAP
jgi:hypothetical protein